MKKPLLPVLLLLFVVQLSTSLHGQNAFYYSQYVATLDSAQLREMFKEGDPLKAELVSYTVKEREEVENLITFMRDPFSARLKSINFDIIRQTIAKHNAYVEARRALLTNPLALNTLRWAPAAGATASVLSLIPNLVLGSVSLSDSTQSNIIDGLTKYYAEEFRKAQLITYLKAFQATAGRFGELQILFPQSYRRLQNADPSRFPDLGNEYKKIFNEDLGNAWENLLAHIENGADGEPAEASLTLLGKDNLTLIRQHKAYFPAVISSEILFRLIDNQHPVDVLHYVDTKYYNASALQSTASKDIISRVIHGINLLQANLRDSSKVVESRFSNVWINSEQLRELNTENELKYFFGLIYQQDKTYVDHLLSAFGVAKSDITKLKWFLDKRVTPLINYFQTIEEAGKSLESSDEYEVLIKYLEANMHLYTSLGLAGTNPDISGVFNISKNLVHVYASIRKTDYSNMMHYILNILQEFLPNDSAYQNVVLKIQEYGGFMAEIVNAEDSEAVKETITRFAAAPSTFMLKRTYRHTLSITGQPGYFGSFEKLDGQDEWKFVSGITLPMGFEYSYKPKKDVDDTRSSVGFFFQLLDLGAVLNFRIDDSTSELPDKITFRQIFSPGGSINYGFRNSPLAVAFGYQYTPELRKVTLDDGAEKFATGDRWFLRFAWDIPLVNIVRSKSR